MPTLSPGTLVPFFACRNKTGAIATRSLAIAASQTIAVGDAIVKTSGAATYEQALANPSAGSTTAQSGDLEVVGFAMEPIATNASAVDPAQGNKNEIQVAIFENGTTGNQFCLPIYNATAANAEPRDLTLGTAYELVRVRSTSETTGRYYINTVSTNGDCTYVETYAGSAEADDYGAVWFCKDSFAV
jgi:hypothetical protein